MSASKMPPAKTRPLPAISAELLATAKTLVSLAIDEDLSTRGDITSRYLIPEKSRGRVAIVARKPGCLAGTFIIPLISDRLAPNCDVEIHHSDGDRVTGGEQIAILTGPVRELLAAERTILNFMTHLSGIATLTARFVAETAGTNARIYDTRKTHPGYRLLEKYAVAAGGGQNHRMGLFDMVLIKDNHLAAWHSSTGKSIADAVRFVRQQLQTGGAELERIRIQVEVDTLEQFHDAISGEPDLILLDNMSPEMLAAAVQARNSVAAAVTLEASGGVDLNTVRRIAETGIERISVGALTHSAPALDIAFDWLSADQPVANPGK